MSRYKNYSAKQIRTTLAKHEWVKTDVHVNGAIDLCVAEVADPYALLDRMIAQAEEHNQRVERFPYWAELWPASVALARWLCRDSSFRPQGPVLELGCGLGIVGIALARLGWPVEATDFVEDALIFASHNAALNRVQGLHVVGYLDWRNPVGAPCACMVASDILYEKKNHPYLRRLLRRLLLPGGYFFTADPGRQVAQAFVTELVAGGYHHACHRVEQEWRSQSHNIDIHVFAKPTEPEA